MPKKIRAIHAKAANRRKDFLHKGGGKDRKGIRIDRRWYVSQSKLAKTAFAKSVRDAGWAGFKDMLSYKAIMHGGMCLEVHEAWTSQVCSCCGCLPRGRPKGIADLPSRKLR
jgi:putative transposase